ncbi:uncharacterized protein LOC134210355 [Armigeres subalbatus]|uniref:uncharacterized protein LOC134210355 n=1 Tax=Armigeres subalbatus TaxID=124917 RepID=UPI002ED37BC2
MLNYFIISSVLLAYASATPVSTFLTPAGEIIYATSFPNYVAPEQQTPLQLTYPSYLASERVSGGSPGISRITEYDAAPLVPVAAAAPARYYATLLSSSYY